MNFISEKLTKKLLDVTPASKERKVKPSDKTAPTEKLSKNKQKTMSAANAAKPDQIAALPAELAEEIAALKKPKRALVNKLNDLEAKEWIPETVSVWVQRGLGKGHEHAQIERQHPAPFSFQDIARLVRFFTKAGETVLDPFVGIGSTLKAAALEGRHGIGIELNKKYAKLAKQRLSSEIDQSVLLSNPQQVIQGDARKAISKIKKDSVKLVVTSPPYWNILHKTDHKTKQERVAHELDTQYSDDPADLGNILDYSAFVSELGSILALTRECLVAGGHLCLVVGDFRHKSNYFMFHADIAHEMEKHGFTLKGIKILYQKHKRVFPYGFPYSYVPNMHHQYIVILAK
jgi:DNA modification methylase